MCCIFSSPERQVKEYTSPIVKQKSSNSFTRRAWRCVCWWRKRKSICLSVEYSNSTHVICVVSCGATSDPSRPTQRGREPERQESAATTVGSAYRHFFSKLDKNSIVTRSLPTRQKAVAVADYLSFQ